MSLQPRVLRRLFAAGAVLAIVVATGFYLRGILKGWHSPNPVPQKIPENVAQTAKGFTFSKSEGQRMLFTIQASSFQQFKDGERYELHGASITLFGRQGDRSDHIYGSDFQYDKSTGNIIANGEVQIDLQVDSPAKLAPNAPVASPGNMVFLKTSGLTFNDNSGVARTKERIEFRLPGANGSAIGAVYNSRESVLQLKSAVKFITTGPQPATIIGQSAVVLRGPQRVIVEKARIEQPPRVVTTDKMTVLLRDDNTVQRIEGEGNVHAVREEPKGFDVSAPQGELSLDGLSQLRSGLLTGGVEFSGKDEEHPSHGRAGRLLLSFAGKGALEKIRAEDSVDFTQGPASKSHEIQAAAADFVLRDGKILEKATTAAGPAQILLTQGTTKSTISAGQFDARFSDENRLRSIVGTPNAKIVSVSPNQPDRVSTSRQVLATFNARGEITSAEQDGGFHFTEGQREAWAEHARYNPVDESYVLTGSPRVTEPDRSLTADTIQLNRRNSTAVAQGNVKTTYIQKAQPNGAMLAAADPVHVTGSGMTATRVGGSARYTAARLWRGGDIVQAPTIVFDQAHRAVHAEADTSTQVSSVFVQTDKKGKITPVNVTSDRLDYVDADRKAVFTGNVVMKIEGATITAQSCHVFLEPRNTHIQNTQAQTGGASQLDHIVAVGDVRIEQPNRKATGKQLVYTARDEKFVLTGSPVQPPSIFDAERGQIKGDSLTFFTHDGRVLVGSGESSQNITETKVQDTNKK